LKHTQKQVKITRFNGFPGISRVFQHTARGQVNAYLRQQWRRNPPAQAPVPAGAFIVSAVFHVKTRHNNTSGMIFRPEC